MIEMELTGVRVELPTNQPIVLLREREGERYLPIWIGAAEAAAIALSLQGVVTPRPMTHDLLKTILEDLTVQVRRIVVTELRESTFFATIELDRQGQELEVSSRPSDAIALAVRMSVPIFASEDVLERSLDPDPRRRGGRGREVPGVPGQRQPGRLRELVGSGSGNRSEHASGGRPSDPLDRSFARPARMEPAAGRQATCRRTR